MLQWFNKKIHNRKGFTLIELVIVIAILGILAAIAVPRFAESRVTAAKTAHNANVRTLESAASMYVAQVGIPAADMDADDTKAALDPKYVKWPTPVKGTGDATVDNIAYTVTISDDGAIVVAPAAVALP